ncbi:SAM-dependent methyltransferase [Amycolatopsis sp. NPDC059090]|uniref:SAM-dependent methyltransferase n=1 Tax=unclassified Amycolatopsis TaxID=2618356 RepID=UPI00366B4D39
MTDNAGSGVLEVPWNLTVPEADIHLVGYGLRLPNDLTLEALAVLKRCNRVFGIPALHAPEFGLPAMENLYLNYGTEKNRHQTYREWLDLVLDAAATDGPVALATSGSVMVGALVAHRILEEAPRRGLTVHVTHAASCFDGIWADLNIEPFFGFTVWEATAFVKLRIRPDTGTTLMLPQAPIFDVTTGPDTTNGTIRTSTAIAAIRDHLLGHYPPQHQVHFVHTGSGTGARGFTSTVETLPLAELDHPGRNPLSTLVVPRLAPSTRLDFQRPDTAAAKDTVPG